MVSTGQLLSTAWNDDALRLHTRELDFLKNTNYDLPRADELEFRTESDEMDFDRQEYLLRFRFHSKAERNAQQQLHRSNIRREEAEQKLLLSEALMERYLFLVKYKWLLKKLKIINARILVAEDEWLVLNKRASALPETNLKELLNAENEKHELEMKKLALQGQWRQLQSEAQSYMESDRYIQVDTSSFLTIEKIKEKWKDLLQSTAPHPALVRRHINIEKNTLEYEKEKARNSWKIDYVQLKYAGRDRLNYWREWSFGLGLEIPLPETNRLGKNDFLLRQLELENRLRLQETDLDRLRRETARQLESKIEQHELAARQLAESQARYAWQKYPGFKDANPLLLLNIKKNILKKRLDQTEVEEDIYRLYLKLIALSGQLTEWPLRNYLSENREILKNR